MKGEVVVVKGGKFYMTTSELISAIQEATSKCDWQIPWFSV